ncbi:MAG: Fic family protein [Gammaproteobacteria bacterium]|nr:Fic family protein [Gammaproteobacteria bacterium]
MKNTGRYNTQSSDEGEYQTGSGNMVLKNLLHITLEVEMEQIETRKFIELSQKMIFSLHQNKCLYESDIIQMHHEWLKDVYGWAGHYRQVNMSKGGFTFAAAHLVPKLMQDFEKKILAKYTPCIYKSEDEILNALAVVHVELILIHPFREGNGRLARLISQLMALQAQLPLLDFSIIAGEQKERYFAAVRQGLGHDYEPMKAIFSEVIAASR